MIRKMTEDRLREDGRELVKQLSDNLEAGRVF